MNYYIIPKNNFKIKLFLLEKPEPINPVISYSLIFHLNDVYTNLLKLEDSANNMTIDHINKIVNPFEFIHTNVPGYQVSVSKVKPESNIFFELMEIFQLCNIFDSLLSPSTTTKNKMNITHLTPNYTSTNYLLNMLREDNEDNVVFEDFDYKTLCDKFVIDINPTKIDLFIFEFKDEDYTDMKQYIKNVLLVLYIITKYQSNRGTSIIKLDGIFYKIIIDVLLIFTAIYDKVFLIKPTISSITTGERYIICKHLNYSSITDNNLLSQIEEKLTSKLANDTICNNNIHSFLSNEIPYYFLNKIEESNAVIGQQQLESYDQIINIFKNKNKDEKLETLKRNHIQKCVQWCEKNQIPHNKFTDKINIFLNSKKKEDLL